MIVLAPKSEQPKGGYKHPRHLLGYGPKHLEWTWGGGWHESNRYCVSPSSRLWQEGFLNG